MKLLLNKLINDKDNLYRIIDTKLMDSNGFLLTYFNQNSFNIAYENYNFYKLLLNSFNVYQEGIGLYIYYLLKKQNKFTRIDATEVIYYLIFKLIENNKKIVFFGSNFNKEKFIEDCRRKNLLVTYYHNGNFELYKVGDLIEELKSINAEYFLIGMGSPKQEFVAYELSKHFTNGKFICIGNFINYFLNYQKRAPKFIRVLQLEWLYRLIVEPKRLFKRYVIGIPLYFARIFYILIKN